MALPTLWRTRRPTALADLLDSRRELDQMLDRFFWGDAATMAAWTPSIDVRETEDEIIVSAELPGMKREDVKLTVEDGRLCISGEKRQENENGSRQGEYHVVERSYGRFERSFALPRSVDPEKINASFKDGILDVHLTKTATAKPKQIAIK